MSRPADLKFTKSHEWVRLTGGVAELGITDYAIEQLGDLAFVDLPDVGARVTAGDAIGEIESTKTVSELYAPADGEVVEVNADLVDGLDLVSEEPFSAGWMVRIRLANPEDSLGDLLSAADYDTHVEAEEAH